MQEETVDIEGIRTNVYESKSWQVFYVHKYFLCLFQKITVYIWNFRVSFEIVCALRGPYLPALFPQLYFSPWPHPVKAAGVVSPLFRQRVFDIHMVPTASGIGQCCDCHMLLPFVFCYKPPSSSPMLQSHSIIMHVSVPFFFRNPASMLPLATQSFSFMRFCLLSSISGCSIAHVQQVASKSLPVKRRLHPVVEEGALQGL